MTDRSSLASFDACMAGASIVNDPAELIEFFADARGAHLYALADTEEPFWSASRWYRSGDAVVGLVGLSDDMITVYSVSTKDPTGTLDLVSALAPELAGGTLLTGPVGLGDVVRRVREVNWDGPHVRYELGDRAAVDAAVGHTCDLNVGDHAELEALYSGEPGAVFFQREMLGDETYVGIRRGGVLVAAAGTHVASTALGVAAVGAVYVQPEFRGQGLGRTVTAGVIQRLGDRAATIGLNVSANNGAARAVYESLGFRAVLVYDESELT